MSSSVTLPKGNSGHLAPNGKICCNNQFNVESAGAGSGTRAFCTQCKAEVTIVGNKTITASLYKCG